MGDHYCKFECSITLLLLIWLSCFIISSDQNISINLHELTLNYTILNPNYLLLALLLLPLALQPTVSFGLSNKILPFFPICHQLSPSSLNPSSFFLYSTFVTISFLLFGVVSPTPNPQPGGPVYPFLSGSWPLTCLAWEALPVAYATASIALEIMWPHKSHHNVKVGIPSWGCYLLTRI
jgi:hypothetical protein